jgi:hypothetical protein
MLLLLLLLMLRLTVSKVLLMLLLTMLVDGKDWLLWRVLLFFRVLADRDHHSFLLLLLAECDVELGVLLGLEDWSWLFLFFLLSFELVLLDLLLLFNTVFTVPDLNLIDLILSKVAKISSALRMKPSSIDTVIFT